MHRGIAIAAATGLWLAASGPFAVIAGDEALAPKPIGKVVTVVGRATIERAGPPLVQVGLGEPAGVKVGDPVYRGDRVATGDDSKLGLNFSDGSSFNLSANAAMKLDEFVYDPDGASNTTLFSLAKGTATFVAGKVAKTGSMKVDTPVATLGVRGTTPHIEIAEDGTARFSTLIEEGKEAVMKRRDAPAAPARVPRQRRADRGFGICRGC